MKKKMLMYVYSDIKTDARVMRTVSALKGEYDLTLIATNSLPGNSSGDGYNFVDYTCSSDSPLTKYLYSLKTVWQTIRRVKPDYIYCHDYYSAPVAWSVSKKRKCKCIYDAHELYVADENSSLRERTCCFLERKAITHADQVICASQRRKNIMDSLYHTKRPIAVIDNISILPDHENPDSIINQFSGLSDFLSDPIPIIVYCGAIIKARRLDKLIDAANKLKDKVKVLIIGAGEDLQHIKQYSEKLNMNNVFWCDSVPYINIKSIIQHCKAGYLYYENDTLNNSNCAPNKIYEYASAGLPMIANSNEGLKEIIDHYQIGCTSNDIPEAIECVLNNYDKYKRCLDYFLDENSWDNLSLRLREAIRSL